MQSPSPLPACGERSDCIEDAIRVRGALRESNSHLPRGEPPSPQPSPRRRGEGVRQSMAAIDYEVELRRAGAYATGGGRGVLFLAPRDVLGAAGLVIMIAFVFTAIFADFIARYDPLTIDSARALARPSLTHWMGTDSF